MPEEEEEEAIFLVCLLIPLFFFLLFVIQYISQYSSLYNTLSTRFIISSFPISLRGRVCILLEKYLITASQCSAG
jgi:hypothetical protein